MNLLLYDFLCLLSIHEYAYYVVISLLFMDGAWKKQELSFVQNWHSHAIIDIQNPLHKLRGLSISMNYQVIILKTETLMVLSSITKKGEIESASRPLMSFGD
jgi:hypothetical protein